MWTFHGHILMQNCIHLCVSLHADMHQYHAKPGSSVSSPVEEQTRGKQKLFLCILYLCLVQLLKQIALRKYITMQAQKQFINAVTTTQQLGSYDISYNPYR